MFKTILTLIVCLFISSGLYAQYDAKEIILQSYKSLSIRKSIQYNADCRFKFFDHDDTMQFTSNVQMLKNNTDTIFGAYLKYTFGDTMYACYDMEKIFFTDSKNKTVKIYDPHKGEYWAMTGNIHNRVVIKSFFEPERMKRLATEDGVFTILPDTTINGKECYRIEKKVPDNGEFSDNVITTCFNKTDKIPVYQYSRIKLQGNYQYNTIKVSNYRFNTLSKEDFSFKTIPAQYSIDTFKDEPLPELLSAGTPAPLIKGQHYQDNMSEITIDFKGKVTLLDYWYMACYPCVKAIPCIEKLYEKYAGKGLQVYGINSSDKKRLDKMPNFLEHNPIKYPIVMVGNEIPGSYNVRVWPTFYIIDKDGKVAFSKLGFGEDTTEKTLEEELEKLFSQK